jgi:hypothetical protein
MNLSEIIVANRAHWVAAQCAPPTEPLNSTADSVVLTGVTKKSGPALEGVKLFSPPIFPSKVRFAFVAILEILPSVRLRP